MEIDTPKKENETPTFQLTDWEVDVLILHWLEHQHYHPDCFSVRDIRVADEADNRLAYIGGIVGLERIKRMQKERLAKLEKEHQERKGSEEEEMSHEIVRVIEIEDRGDGRGSAKVTRSGGTTGYIPLVHIKSPRPLSPGDRLECVDSVVDLDGWMLLDTAAAH